jgi:hypothetical protein
MRGLKTKDTPILSGYQIFHNYIRGHEGLDGKTPSEACGIKIEGKKQVANTYSKCKQQILRLIVSISLFDIPSKNAQLQSTTRQESAKLPHNNQLTAQTVKA